MNKLWRGTVTVGCFAVFSVCGILGSLVVLPLLRLAPGGAHSFRRRARNLVGRSFGTLLATLQRTGVMRLELSGMDRLQGAAGALVIANHPTYIDVVALLSLLPSANCVVKADLWRNPFYWGIVRAAGYISCSSPESLLAECCASLARGEPLVIFPEGTRSRPGLPLRFQRGASHVALRAECAVLPVLITCRPITLSKGQPWWSVPERPFVLRIEVQEALAVAGMASPALNDTLRVRELTHALEHYFTHQQDVHGHA
ncbi:MAG: 1-acyl-sn-glycerol-3-phosphate acyltransferase [Rhodocyclaceae bacterium]|nr:1-acyl-sn-glycerol-3-phosphate acyltransferase [Rhodocyclaceae bacterium]